MKSPYRIGGEDCCRHHIIRATVTAGVITEVKPGAGPVVVTNQATPTEEQFRPFQR